MNAPLLASLSSQFGWIDWTVVVGYLAFTTFLGAKLAGRQASMRDFFLGGRKLPWYAVSGSIIATEISALTFVSVPSIVFKIDPEGNFTYLQLGLIGTFLARIIVGYVLVPAYYEREIYSPYDYMGNKLGGHVRSMTSVLFSLGGILGQSARIYLTAEVVMVVLKDQLANLESATGMPALAWAIFLIGVVSVGWTLIGGITTVIWTDVLLFLVFLLGAVVALGTVIHDLPGGLGQLLSVGYHADHAGPWGKFTFFNFDLDPARQYTIWTAAFLSTWGSLGAYGTDQLLAQRMFCCKDARDARWAIISSTAGQLVTITVMLVGVGLYAYYTQEPSEAQVAEMKAEWVAGQTEAGASVGSEAIAAEPLDLDAVQLECHPQYPSLCGDAYVQYAQKEDRIFPIFILQRIPTGLKGLIIAGIFAAAISSLMGILTALSQVVMSAFYNPLRERQLRKRGVAVSLSDDMEGLIGGESASAEDRRSVFVGRLMVVFWGVVLCLMAYLASFIAQEYKSILDLGLAMVGFTAGALIAGFALAFLPLNIDGRGFMWSGPLSCLCVFALVWHAPWTHTVCWIAAVVFLVLWLCFLMRDTRGALDEPDGAKREQMVWGILIRDYPQTLLLLLGLGVMLWLNYHGYWYEHGPDGSPVLTEAGIPIIRTLSWPWYAPVGSTIAFIWGYLLAGRRTEEPEPVA